jgi:hypothetical protein
MLRAFILNAGKWAARVLIALTLAVSTGVTSAQSNAGSAPQAPGKSYLLVVVRTGPGLVPLTAQYVDCPRNISGMSGHSLRLDGSNHPHIAYGSDHLYHTWNDGGSWKTEVVDPAPGVGYAASLAFDGSGKAGISYYDDFNHSLKLARWSGTAWALQTVDSSPYAGYTSSLAFDSTGKPRIAYIDYDSSQSVYHIKYAAWNGTTWNIFPVIDNAGEASLSLALDQSGQPHISYWRNNYPQTGGLIYASWGGSAWTLQIVEEDTDAGRNNALAFDSQNKPHISYLDDWDGAARFASWSGTAWTTEDAFGSGSLAMDRNNPTSLVFGSGDMPMIAISLGESEPKETLVWLLYKSGGVWHHDQNYDIVGSGGARWPAIAADSSGKPHISYLDYHTGQLHYASLTTWGPDTWSNAIIDAGAQVGQGASLAMDRFGKPHISFHDSTYAEINLKYAHKSSGGWQVSVVDKLPIGITGLYNSIAIDSGGKPHISYYNYYNGGLWYASWNGSSWDKMPVDNIDSAGFYSSLALDSLNHPHICYADEINYYVKYATYNGSQWSVKTLTAADPGRADMRDSICSIEIGSGNVPYVSYFSKIDRHLAIAHPVIGSWVSEIVDASGDNGEQNSLGMYNGVPYIAYYHSSNKDLQFMMWK